MMNEEKIEKKMQEKGLNAPRLTPAVIDSKIKEELTTFTKLPSGKSLICELVLVNGYSVRGEASCVSVENYDQEIGKAIAYQNARDKIWQLEGYLLQEQCCQEEYCFKEQDDIEPRLIPTVPKGVK